MCWTTMLMIRTTNLFSIFLLFSIKNKKKPTARSIGQHPQVDSGVKQQVDLASHKPFFFTQWIDLFSIKSSYFLQRFFSSWVSIFVNSKTEFSFVLKIFIKKNKISTLISMKCWFFCRPWNWYSWNTSTMFNITNISTRTTMKMIIFYSISIFYFNSKLTTTNSIL